MEPLRLDPDAIPEKSLIALRQCQEEFSPGRALEFCNVELGRAMCDQLHDPRTGNRYMAHSFMTMRLGRIGYIRDDLLEQTGLACSEVRMWITAEGEVGWEVDFDGPPRTPLPNIYGGFDSPRQIAGNAAADLRMHPRPPERVPVWVKAWLATQGGWDIERDVPTFDDDFTGTPVDYDTAYAALYAKNPSVVPHAFNAPDLASTTTTTTTAAAQATAPEPATPIWPVDVTPVDPTGYTALQARLQDLAHTWPDIVKPLPPLTAEALSQIDPAYHAAATALPGLNVLDPDGPLGLWHTYTWLPSTPPTQTLLDSPEVTVTIMEDHLQVRTRTNPEPHRLNATTLDWWTTITTSLETHLPHIAEYAHTTLEEEGTTPEDDPEGFTLTQHEILLTLIEDDLTTLTTPRHN